MSSSSAPATSGDSPTMLGLEEEWLSSDQEAIPAPYFSGRARLGSKWLCDVLRSTNTPIKQDMGKAGTKETGKNWYGDIAAEYCCGAVDVFDKIYYDGKIIWDTPIDRGEELYEDIQIKNFAEARIHWGTSEQLPSDYVLNSVVDVAYPFDRAQYPQEYTRYDPDSGTVPLSGGVPVAPSGLKHPGYRHLFYVEWKKLFFGPNRKTVPDLELLLGRSPRPVGISLPEDLILQGINPLTAIAELLTNPFFGLGWDADVFRTDNWQEVAGQLAAKQVIYYINPYFSKGTSVRAMIGTILRYIDGFVVPKQGKLEVGFYPHDGVVPEVVELTHHDKKGTAKISSPGWAETVNEVQMTFRDKNREMKKSSEPGTSSYNRAIVGVNRPQKMDGSFWCTRKQAKRAAEEAAVTQSFPNDSGIHTYRLSRANNLDGTPIMPGDRWQLHDNDHELRMLVRCKKRVEERKKGTVMLSWERERGMFAMQYSDPVDLPVKEVEPVTPIAAGRLLELQPQFTGSVRTTAVILAERPAANVEFFNVWLSESGETYDHLFRQDDWALRGTLLQDIPWTEPAAEEPTGNQSRRVGVSLGEVRETVDVVFAVAGYDITKLQPQSTQQQADNTLLLVSGDEIFSLGNTVAEGAGHYRATAVLRHREGSATQAHFTGGECWVVTREELLENRMSHRAFVEGDNRWFKLQSSRVGISCALSESFVLQHSFTHRPTALPIITFEPLVGDVVTGEEIHLRGIIEDQNEDIIQWDLTVVSIRGEVNIAGSSVLTGRVEFDVPHTFLVPGAYYFKVTAADMENQLIGVSEVRWPEASTIEVTGEDLSVGTTFTKSQQMADDLALFEKHADDLQISANKTADALVQQAADFLAKIELTELNLGHSIEVLEDHRVKDGAAIALTIKKWGTKTDLNGSAIVESRQSISTNGKTIAEVNTTLLSKYNNAWDTITGQVEAVKALRTEIKVLGQEFSGMAQEVKRLKIDYKNIYNKTNSTADLLQTQVVRINTNKNKIAAQVTVYEVLDAKVDGDHAVVTTLKEAYVEDGRAIAFASMEIDAGGKHVGWRMIGGTAPNGRTYGELILSAPTLKLDVDGHRYKAVVNSNTAVIDGESSYKNKGAWIIGNNKTLGWEPVSGPVKLGRAKVRIYALNDYG